jgi:superfamily II DNA or RNA helicase
MNLKELDLEDAYNSDLTDVLTEFYVPALSCSARYYRLTGDYSSSILAAAASGIRDFLENDGEMKLIVGAFANEKDVNAIKAGVEQPEEIVERSAIKQLDDVTDEFVRDHVAALGWMVAKRKLQVKFALVLDEKSDFIFHQKIGILEDLEGNRISFSGSENESYSAWKGNVEDFMVFRSWVAAQKGYLDHHWETFRRFWENRGKRTKVIDIPVAVENRLIQFSSQMKIEDIRENLAKWEAKIATAKLHRRFDDKTPFYFQENARDAIRACDYSGILKMATGTGKTYTALLSVHDYLERVKRWGNRVLVIVPSHLLVEQWLEDLQDFAREDDVVVSYDSKKSAEEKRMAIKSWKVDLRGDQKRNVFLVITVDSISNFQPFEFICPDIVVGDEVHAYGTEHRMDILRKTFSCSNHRIGLSATPERAYDQEGTERVLNFFKGVKFTYPIKQALKDGVLAEYSYYPVIVRLTAEEETKVRELTDEIRKRRAIDHRMELTEKEGAVPSRADYLIRARALKLKTAVNKMDALEGILKEHRAKLKQCIIYCEDTGQLNNAKKVFDNVGMGNSYFHYDSMVPNRAETLRLFKVKNRNYVLSMHCLDQGVDIPSCESLIMLSSSTNPREYIQRRGRVLRNPPGKVKPPVKIFDVSALPMNADPDYKGMIVVQLARAWEFIRCSNTPEAKLVFRDVRDSYGIKEEEILEILEAW